MAEVTLAIGAAAACRDGFAGEPIRLRYTEAEFKDLGPAEETLAEFVAGYEAPVQLLPAGEGWRSAGGPAILHVLLRRHPWGHAEPAVPVGKVSGFETGIQLSIAKHEVKDLAP